MPEALDGHKKMKSSALRIALILAVNVVFTVITAAVVGPSPSKLQEQLGLVGWAARAPFYLLPLTLTPLTLWVRPRVWQGLLTGLVLALPLAFWAKATACPLSVQLTYLISVSLQGALLSWCAVRFPASSP